MACMKNHLKTNQKVPHHDCVIFLKINMADKTNPNTDLMAHYDMFYQESSNIFYSLFQSQFYSYDKTKTTLFKTSASFVKI